MSDSKNKQKTFRITRTEIFVGIVIALGVALVIVLVGQSLVSAGMEMASPISSFVSSRVTPEHTAEVIQLTPMERNPTPTAMASSTRKLGTPVQQRPPSTPTQTPTPTLIPTPTLDLDSCNAAGCGSQAVPLPPATAHPDLFLRESPATRRHCLVCPRNEILSTAQLNELVAANGATLARLREIALSQETYEIAPGIVYIVFNNVHHVVIDLTETGYILRNIIPPTSNRGTLITPSYCLSPKSLLVTTADYHGLNGSNKTETGRDLFFHLGRAALYQRGDRFLIDVIRTRPAWERTSISWGGGPLFMWNGRYDYNPEHEWFDRENLEHYRTTRWTKLTAAISKDRKYLFISASYGLTLREHAKNIIELGQKWGIKVDRAMRFDGSESAYMAIRLGDYMVPVLKLEEPLIVNCFAIEKSN